MKKLYAVMAEYEGETIDSVDLDLHGIFSTPELAKEAGEELMEKHKSGRYFYGYHIVVTELDKPITI